MSNGIFASSPPIDSQNSLIEHVSATILSLGSVILLIAICSYRCTNPPQQASILFAATKGRGLDEVTLGAYLKRLYCEIKLQYSSSSTASGCSICFVDYKEVYVLMMLPNCGHLFHEKCINQWLQLNYLSPITQLASSGFCFGSSESDSASAYC